MDYEVKKEGPSYSYHTLEDFRKRHGGHEWFWIMGGDQWRSLESWAKPEVMAELATFIVLARDGELVTERAGRRLIVAEGDRPASSTEIRDALKRGEADVRYLDPRVEAEMRKTENE